MNDYLKVFSSILKENALSDYSPNELVENWGNFVEECKEGYSYSLYDYDLEISIREEIELILRSEDLKRFDEFALFMNRIKLIDQEFILITIDVALPILLTYWWKSKIPKYSKQQFANNVKSEYGLDIEVI